MALCRRHPGLRATIVDLPGSARIGREIVAEAGMADRVHHVEGDMFEADLGGPHDGALCFNIVHHLSPERAKALFARIPPCCGPARRSACSTSTTAGRPEARLRLDPRPLLPPHLGRRHLHRRAGLTLASDAGFGPAEKKTFRNLPSLAMLGAKAI